MDDLALLTQAALAGGELAMRFFRKNPNAWSKAGGSPVTEADMEVDTLLKTTLLAKRPNYGWLSEETADDPARLGLETIFVVDPIDGTRGFIEGDERWCVSIAVVRRGRPIVAALYAPARNELFTAREGEGAWLGAERLAVPRETSLSSGRIAGPRGWLKSAHLRGSGVEIQGHVPSLAYRFARVASGASDMAFASPRAHDWDLAAADLLVHEAGGRLTNLDGTVPTYNRETTVHGVLAAANPALHAKLLGLLTDVSRERAGAGLPV